MDQPASRILNTIVWVLGFAGAGVGIFFSARAGGLVGELPRATGGDFLVNTLTLTSTKEDFVRAVMSAAARVRPNMSVTSRGLLAAWAGLESGWGKTRQAKLANNIFNVSKGSWTGPTLPGADLEYAAGSTTAKAITQQWRQYASLDASIADLLLLLESSKYTNYREAVADLMAGQPTFATRLGVFDFGPDGKTIVRVDARPNTAGYFTEPRSRYQSSISKCWADVQSIIAKAGLQGLTC